MISTKHYIHVCRHKDATPNISGLIEKIKETAQIEQRIALRKGKLELHERKWKRLLSEMLESA